MESINPKTVEKIFSSQVRLKIIAALVVTSPLLFNDFIEELSITKGNLSSHMRTLEEASFITIKKQFIENRPQTSYNITDIGSSAFKQYVLELEKIISIASKNI
jgi:DNA-binding HxlR family transcriptional regulator